MSDARHPEVRAFSLLIGLEATKFVLLSVFTLTSLVQKKHLSFAAACSRKNFKNFTTIDQEKLKLEKIYVWNP